MSLRQHGPDNDRWYILGAGAIGCLWAAAFMEAGRSCTLILKKPGAPPVSVLTLHEKDTAAKQFSVSTVSVCSCPAPVHRLIISTKAYDAAFAVRGIRHCLAPGAVVVVLCNGMGVQHEIAELLDDCSVFFAVTTNGSWRSAPLVAHHAGRGGTLVGTPDKRMDHRDCPLPSTPRFPYEWCEDIELSLWHKLAVNSVINGLTALYRCANGELLTCPERKSRLEALAGETSRVLHCAGVSGAGQVLSSALSVLEKTRDNVSSTLQDIISGRRTELEVINGYLIRQADVLGVEVSSHKHLMRDLKQNLHRTSGQALSLCDGMRR